LVVCLALASVAGRRLLLDVGTATGGHHGCIRIILLDRSGLHWGSLNRRGGAIVGNALLWLLLLLLWCTIIGTALLLGRDRLVRARALLLLLLLSETEKVGGCAPRDAEAGT